MNRRIGMGGAVALGLSVFLAVPAAHAQETGTAPAATGTTIHVPSGFDKQLEDKRANGHYEVVGTGLHVYTDGNADLGADGKNSDKVAEYVDTNLPLAKVGEPSLEYTDTDPALNLTDPGFQLVVNLDGTGGPDGILVGEPGSYGDRWWLAGASQAFLASIDPNVPGTAAAPGAGEYPHIGPLSEWRKDFPSAQVLAFGFSLGSGVHGDGTINAIDFAGTPYTFADDVVLTSKDDCKGGGWATSTAPVYKNQGECVSSFARTSNSGRGSGATAATGTGTGTATSVAAPASLTPRNTGRIKAI